MSRTFLTLLLSLPFSAILFAQDVSKGRMGNDTAPPRTLSPNPTLTRNKPTEHNVQPSLDRGSIPQTSQPRPAATTTLGNTTTKRPAQDRSANPNDSKPLRPSSYAPPTPNAKGVVDASNQKAKSLKTAERGVVNWLSLEEALARAKNEKRKLFVDMYTDWCGWCKHMDSTTFVDASVAKYLNEHYYPVKFNAEQDSEIVFKDKTYRFKKSGSRGFHELAAMWLNNRLSFPTVVFLDENQQLIQSVPGYQDAEKMDAIINYFGSDSHKKTPWESYEKNFSERNNKK